MLNTRCTQWSTYRSRIWAMRSPPQKVTGYRYEEEMACEQRSRDSKGGYYAEPLVSLSLSFSFPLFPRCFALVSQLLFFDASSFLIAANRDVKTIRVLLLDSQLDAQFFSRYRNPFFALFLSFSIFRSLSLCFPYLCLRRKMCSIHIYIHTNYLKNRNKIII